MHPVVDCLQYANTEGILLHVVMWCNVRQTTGQCSSKDLEALPFWHTTSNQNLNVENALCLQCILPTHPVAMNLHAFQILSTRLPRLCYLPLSQTHTAISIPAPGAFGHCVACDSQADQDLVGQRHSAGSSAKICTPWLAGLHKSQREECAEMEEERVECAGWLCTLVCKSCSSTTNKRASNHKICTKCQSSWPPERLCWSKWGGDVIYLTFDWVNLSNLYISF